jgi:hypothetical protein
MALMLEPSAWRARALPWLSALLVLALAGPGCSTDTAGLERQPSDVPAGGSPGEPAAPAGSAGDVGNGGSGAAPVTGAPGVGALDVVHGLIDGGNLFVCLWDVASGQLVGADAPAQSGGVAYGQSLRLPTTWDLTAVVDVELFVAAGQGMSGLTCSGLHADAVDGEALRPSLGDAGLGDAGSLETLPFPREPVVPRRAGSVRLSPGAVSPGGHYALVAAGCTSPAGSPSEDLCGPPDSLFESQRTVLLAELASGVTGGAGVGLQFLNASRAVTRADLVLQSENQRQSLRLTSDVQFGAVRPRNAAPVDEPLGVELHVRGATQSSYTQAWSETTTASGSEALTGGENYLLVYVGPAPGALPGGIAPPRFVLVRGD